MTPTPPGTGPSTRNLTLILILITAAFVAAVAGLLAYAGGALVPTAILTGGGAYAGTVALGLAIAHYASGGHG
jgi:hypothetical protein